MLREQLKALQQIFIEEREKSEKISQNNPSAIARLEIRKINKKSSRKFKLLTLR